MNLLKRTMSFILSFVLIVNIFFSVNTTVYASVTSLNAATNVKAIQSGNSCIVTWDSVNGANCYDVIVTPHSGDVQWLHSSGTEKYINNLTYGNYSFQVQALYRPYGDGDKTDQVVAPCSSSVNFQFKPLAPQNLSVSDDGDNLNLTFDEVSDVTGYELDILSPNGTSSTVSLTENNYILSNYSTGNYEFAVKAYYENDGVKITGFSSVSISYNAKAENIKGLSITDVKITYVDASKYTFQFTANCIGNARAYETSWTTKNGKDDAVKYSPDSFTFTDRGTFTVNINVSEHNNEVGQYNTEIYVESLDTGEISEVYYFDVFVNTPCVLPITESRVYNNKLYARFDKPIANYQNIFSSYFKFAEASDDETLKLCRELAMNGYRSYYIIGGQKSNNQWIWQYSGSAVDTTDKWSDGQPDNSGGAENQLSISSANGLYHDISISSTTPGFIACTDLDEITPAKETYYKTNKYVFYNNTMPYSYSKLFCEAKGGYLASVTSEEENNIVYSLISTGLNAFIGGSKNKYGEFIWESGELFDYSNWRSGEPNNYESTGGQYYVKMYGSDSNWDDCADLTSSKAKETNGFICEYKPSNIEIIYTQSQADTVTESDLSLIAEYPDGSTAVIPYESINIEKKNSITYIAEIVYENERGEENTATKQIQLDESGQCGENAYYTYCGETKTLTISGSGSIYDYNNSAKYHFSNFYNDVEKLVIADGITEIGDNDFSECANLKEVDIPASVTALGTDAFSDCSMLDNVILPDSLKTIGSYSFYRCSNLKQIIIPKGVESIGQSAFLSCGNLDSIITYAYNADVFDSKSTLPQQAVISSCSGSTAEEYAVKYERAFVSIGHKYVNEAINPTCTKDGYTKYTCTLCDYSFNNDVISAKGHSWNSGTVIQEATEENPVEITQYTCTECNEVYTVETEKAVEHIEHTYDVEITEPTCTEQGFSVYKCRYCNDTYTSDYTDALGHDFGSYVSDGNATTESDGTKTAVCSRCGITDTVSDEGSMIQIFTGECGESAYWSLNTGTGELRIYGSGQTTAYSILFTNKRPPWYSYNKYIKTVVIEEGITSIGSYFLAGCSTISKVYIPSTINSISTTALTNTSKVSEYIVDSENESFTAYNGDLYDKEKTSLIKYASGKNAETVILPGSIEAIGAYAFYYCSNIEKICITGNLKAIGASAFYSCTALTAVNLPNSIESIESNAFNNCSAIENLYIANTQCSIYDNKGTIPANICIYGYSDSTANQFADTYGNEFIAIEDCAHSFSETVTEASCFTGGCTQHLCTLCGYAYYDGYTALTNEHILNDIVKTVEPTCIAEGYTVYRCEVCNREIKADFTSVVEHSYQCVSTILPNCINNGVNYFKCTACGDEYREEISSTGIHSYIGTVILPTCTDRGYTEYICSVCNDEYKADFTDTVSHSFGEYVPDDNSSEFFDGTKTRVCNVCGFKESVNVSGPEIFSNYDESVIAGDTISIPVCIKNNTGVAGMALNFEYDSSVLTPLSVVGGELMQSGLNDNIEGDAKDGSFKVIWYSSSNMTDNGVLLYLNFKVNEKALGSTEIKISYESSDTFNESFDDVVLNCRNILIDIENDDATKWLNSSLKFVNQQSGALSENGCVTAGDVFCLSVDEIGYKSDLTYASYGITYDNKNFTFVGYADKYSHLVDTKAVDSNGSISILFSNNKMYNIKTPDEVFETLGIKYLMFKANDYSSAGDYVFEFNVTDAEGVEEVTSTNCTVTVNASSVSEIANVYIENGISAKVGEEITVPINISNNKGLIGYLVNVSYNPEQIEIISAQKGELFPGNFNSTIGQKEGRFFVLWNTTDNNSENGILFYLRFKVLSEADELSPISLSYSQDDTFNEDYCDVVFNCIDNTIHLNEEEQHSFVDEIVSPTAETKGYTLHTCISCGYSYTDCETDYLSDNSAICAALENVTEYQAEDYSNNSYQLLQGLYFKYIDYPNKSLPQSEFDKAVFDLLTAISALEPYLNLNISAPNGAFTVTYNDETNSNTNHSLLFGTNVTVTATANEGYEFVGWYDTVNNLYFSKNPEYLFKLTTNTRLKAVFVKEQSATLTFTTYSNWVQSTVTKTIDEWNNVSSIDDLLPVVPYRYGYSNGRWVYDNAEVLAKLQTGENVSLIPEYDEDDTSLPTPPSPDGDTPVLDLYYKLDADANVGSFVMAAGIPENCQIESVGVLFYYKNAEEFDPTKFELLINNKMLAGRFNTDEIEDVYIVNMNKMSADKNWAARGYVTYYDAEGNLKTVYSNQINIVNREQV
ncbi:MAG: leucine-rich repeat protein [Eubacterium sp.]